MQLENIHLSINEKSILHAIDFQWKQGESIALMGANGAGKSSLLKVMSTLVKPTSGKLNYPNGSIKQWKESLGIMFPETFLYDSLSAYENLVFYQNLYGKDNKGRIDYLLKLVKLNHVKHEFFGSYSKGMKQRLSIARALVHSPAFLLLDEPFDGLDFESKGILEGLLLQLQENGTGYILVSHNTKHAWTLCDRALLIHDGRIMLEENCTSSRYPHFEERYRALVKENHHDIS